MKISLENFEVVEKEEGIYKLFYDSKRLLTCLESYVNNHKEELIKGFERCYDDYDLQDVVDKEIYHPDQDFCKRNGEAPKSQFSRFLTRNLYEAMLEGITDEKSKYHVMLTLSISERIVVQKKTSLEKRKRMFRKKTAQQAGYEEICREFIRVSGDRYVAFKDIENLNIEGCILGTMKYDENSNVSEDEAEMNCWDYIASNRDELKNLIKIMLFFD